MTKWVVRMAERFEDRGMIPVCRFALALCAIDDDAKEIEELH